jgi:hypothetical protein
VNQTRKLKNVISADQLLSLSNNEIIEALNKNSTDVVEDEDPRWSVGAVLAPVRSLNREELLSLSSTGVKNFFNLD